MTTTTKRSLAWVRIEEFADSLVDATVNLELHSATSPHVRNDLRMVIRALESALDHGASEPLTLDFSAGEIRVEDEILTGPSLHAGRLLRRSRRLGIAGIQFRRGTSEDELIRLFKLFQMEDVAPSATPDALARSLGKHGIERISLIVEHTDDAEPPEDADGSALDNYQRLVGYLQDNHVAAYHGRSLPLDAAQGLVADAIEQLDTGAADLFALASQDNIDRFTVGHSVRVALLALQVARAAGASMDGLVKVGTAALLHDIGKSKVPQEILFKQGHLDEDEWRAMAQHPRLGGEILMEERGIDPTAIGAAFCHHMSPEGGYPTPAIAFEPSGVSKLVRVCDVFEALTAVRPYKHALTPVEAYAVMYRQAHTFDPQWLQFFVRTLGIYPEGTKLLLDDGTEALVLGPGPRLDRPVVRLLTGPAGGTREAGSPEHLIIGETLAGREPRINSVLTPRHSVPVHDMEEPRIHTGGADGESEGCCGYTRAKDKGQ